METLVFEFNKGESFATEQFHVTQGTDGNEHMVFIEEIVSIQYTESGRVFATAKITFRNDLLQQLNSIKVQQ